jgi:hypothetical protein
MHVTQLRKPMALLLAVIIVLSLLPISALATETETPKVFAFIENLSAQPVSYTVGDQAEPLQVLAEAGNEAPVSYQWYSNTAKSTSGGIQIEQATGPSYTPSTGEAGTFYYYVTALNETSSVSLPSNVAELIVSEPQTMQREGAPIEYTGQIDVGNYTISRPEQLVTLAEKVNNDPACGGYAESTFILTGDIDLSSVCGKTAGAGATLKNWVQIGTKQCPFKATFDGNQFTISNLYIESTVNDQGGLFQNIDGASIKNLTLSGTILGKNKAAGFAHTAKNSVIKNCINQISIMLTNNNAAGFIYDASKVQLIQCTNLADISGQSSISGLVTVFSSGSAEENIIDQCENRGEISANKQGPAAGIVRGGSASTIKNSTNWGTVSSSGSGGTAGIAESSGGIIKGCVNYGAITGTDRAAGIVGTVDKGTIEGCTNYGSITATASTSTNHYSAGIVGALQNKSSVLRCYNYKDVNGAVNVGGLVGRASSPTASETITIADSFNRAPVISRASDVKGVGNIGGLIGQASSFGSIDISTCYNTGEVGGEERLPSSGGLIGVVMAGAFGKDALGKVQMQNCYNAASVSGKDNTGGLIGFITKEPNYNSPNITLKNCYTAGDAVRSESAASTGTGIGQIKGLTTQCFTLSNVFARSYGKLKTIGADGASLDAYFIIPRTAPQMTEEQFLSLVGGAYAQFSPAIYGSGENAGEVDPYYMELYDGYEYPVLLNLCGKTMVKPKVTHNVQFLGALYTTVFANYIKTYATTVSDGESVSFTVTSDYPDDPIANVTAAGGTLTETDGVYTLSNINSDAVVTVETTYKPPIEEVDTKKAISFHITDADAKDLDGVSITVKNSKNEEQTATSGVWKLEDGVYAAEVSKEGYIKASGSFAVSQSGPVNVTLYEDGRTSYQLTLETENSGFCTYICNGDIRIASFPDKDKLGYTEHTSITLPAGDYKYHTESAKGNTGGGPLKIDRDKAITLRFVDFSYRLQNKTNIPYTVSVTSSDGSQVYTPGSSDNLDGGAARGYFVLPTSISGEEYRYAFQPLNTKYWGSSGTTYLYKGNSALSVRNFGGLNVSDSGLFVVAPQTEVSISVPSGAELHLYHRVKFYEPLEELKEKTLVTSNGTTTYAYDAPKDCELHYELHLAGYVKKAELFDTAKTRSISITADKLIPVADAAMDISNKYDSDLLTNAPDSNYIELKTGQSFELYLFRNWQAVNSESGNYYVEPDYHMELISGDSVALTDPYYAGTTIQARKSGLSIIRITYDALQYVDSMNKSYLYSKLYEANTVLIFVNVDPIGSASINTGITTQHYDTQYFIKSVNHISRRPADQYAEYTFTPSVQGSTINSVAIHAPVDSQSAWVDAWQPIDKNADGSSYTAKLYEGRSIIRITATDGTQTYYLIKALGLDVTIDGGAAVALNGRQFEISSDVADTLTLSFKGLNLPAPKLAGISNPGYDFHSSGTTYAVYTLTGANTGTQPKVESEKSQYAINEKNKISLSFQSPDTYTLSGGKLHTTVTGSPCGPYVNISKGGATGPQAAYSNGANVIPRRNDLYGALPDITLKINGIPDSGTAHTITITAPKDLKNLTVRNKATGYKKAFVSKSEGIYTYSLFDSGNMTTYVYYAERPGYITKVGNFTVTTEGSTNAIYLGSDWEEIKQSGNASVDVMGYETVLASKDTATISNTPEDLVLKGYVNYNYGGYTVLHALADVLLLNKSSFTCVSGSLSPAITISGTVGANAGWICEVNGKVVKDYANTLLNGDDRVIFYYNPDTAPNMRHAWFAETERSAKRDGSAAFTLMSTPVSNDGSGATPLSGATVYIDGKEWGKTDSSGTITLSGLSNLAFGSHAVTAQLNNSLTFSRSTLKIEKAEDPGTNPNKVSVTFRMIGDTVHPAAYKGYINWIKTEAHVMDKGATMADLFAMVLAAHGMSHDNISDNYVSWVCAPAVLNGYRLDEFSNGPNSGWMYTVNGDHPFLGLSEYVLKDGDEIIWHYANDNALESTYKGSIPKYLNSWLIAADVEPYKGMVDESKNNAENSTMGSTKPEDTAAVVIAPQVTAKDGAAAAKVSASDMSKAIANAKKNESRVIVIEPKVTGKATKTTVEIPKASLSEMTSDTKAGLQINSRNGNVTLAYDVLSTIISQSQGSAITVVVETLDKKTLAADQQKLVGDSTVFDISILSGTKHISSFGGKSITIFLPYTLKSGETADGVTVWYISSSGKLERMTCKYDKTTGFAAFTTTHLSSYVVGYETVWQSPFNDVKPEDWFYDAVKYSVQNELFTGTSATAFSPNADMTRAMLVTALYRMEGKPAIAGTNSFEQDVKSGQWYTDAIIWASTSKLVVGYGDGRFGTNDPITREQMAEILYRYAKMKDYSTLKTAEITNFTDAALISAWAGVSIKWSVAEGLITGNSATTLAPTGTASRAQVATILMRFIKNLVK